MLVHGEQFEYSTPQDVRDEGYTGSGSTDTAKLRERFRISSMLINSTTGQFFTPIHKEYRLDGGMGKILTTPERIPILNIDSVVLLSAGDTQGSITLVKDTDYRLDENRRDIILEEAVIIAGVEKLFIATDGDFNRNLSQIKLKATFGWLDNFKEVSTTANGAAIAGATSLTLADASDIDNFDILMAKDSSGFYKALPRVESISTNTVTFHADTGGLPFAIANADAIVCYGRTPEAIRYVSNYMVSQNMDVFLGSAADTAEFKDRVVYEKTDRYSYKLGSAPSDTAMSQMKFPYHLETILRSYTYFDSMEFTAPEGASKVMGRVFNRVISI